MSPSASFHLPLPHSYTLVFFNLLFLSLDSCTAISSYLRPWSIRAPGLPQFLPVLLSLTFFFVPHLYGVELRDCKMQIHAEWKKYGKEDEGCWRGDCVSTVCRHNAEHGRQARDTFLHTLTFTHTDVYLSVSPSSKGYCWRCYFCQLLYIQTFHEINWLIK